ncbi:hypothetical protein [Brevundimonas guildfordensis]|uniref:DUF2336 domain-containing protein n=1 Tax=Brevundimonas guildfordensis TaxID=2762241 RepID=A0ABR8R4K9_9CAUL|nr:hypothetical protein [Brevundimonas guildfordensis]MBD7942472.1 hypothetical protein [Brevundimonas guildfordensis]
MRDGGLLGWTTDALVKLDDAEPGILARVLTAASARRQSIFATLAKIAVEGNCRADDLFSTDLAYVIRHGRAADILRHAFGGMAEGYPTLLERIGERPLDSAADYLILRDLCAVGHPNVMEAMRSCDRITRSKLRVITALDTRWVHANILSRIDTPAEAADFNRAVTFIQSVSTKATDEAVALAIANMAQTTTLARLLDRLLRRADRLPTHPLGQGDNELRPLRTMREHLEAARKYRNCLAHRLGDIAAGKMAIAEFREEILLEFRPLSMGKGWLFWSAHGPRNALVALDLKDAAAAACERHGVPHVPERTGSLEWRSYRRFVRELEWG